MQSGQTLEHGANDKKLPRPLYHGRKGEAMESSIKTVTIGMVFMVGLIYGGLPAVVAESIIAFMYLILKYT